MRFATVVKQFILFYSEQEESVPINQIPAGEFNNNLT
jgi:hypothetical protein